MRSSIPKSIPNFLTVKPSPFIVANDIAFSQKIQLSLLYTITFILFTLYLLLILSLAVPAYSPNQAAPAPTTIEINPDCSNVGTSSSINQNVQ